MQTTSPSFVLALSIAALLAVAGCSMPTASDFKPSNLFSLGDEDEPKKGKPVRMVGTWTDTVLSQAGQQSQRGFGGRLMFYGPKEEKPIIVDGQLAVYAFDEAGRDVTDNKPTRRYVFPADQLPLHMSKSEIGASYSFWLPWDEVGGPQTEVSLICRFEPKGGAVVTSEQTKHRLPGAITPAMVGAPQTPKLPEGVPFRPAQLTLESLQASRAADHGAQLASYESAAGTGGAGSLSEHAQRMSTTSIALPRGFQLPTGGGNSQPVATPAAATPNLLQQPLHAMPIQGQPPAQGSLPATPAATSAPTPAPQTLRFGALPAAPSANPTTLSPIPYSPTSAGFGYAPSQQQNQQSTAQQPLRPIVARSAAWNSMQSSAAPMPILQHGQVPVPQQTVVQPASQPLPTPTGVTTTVTAPLGAVLR